MFGTPDKHTGANLLSVVKSEYEVEPTRAGRILCDPDWRLSVPDPEKRGEYTTAFVEGHGIMEP